MQESKEQYSNSRDEIPEIAELITEAEAKTDDAANALLNAEEDATKAHDVALSAKDLAGNISKVLLIWITSYSCIFLDNLLKINCIKSKHVLQAFSLQYHVDSLHVKQLLIILIIGCS